MFPIVRDGVLVHTGKSPPIESIHFYLSNPATATRYTLQRAHSQVRVPRPQVRPRLRHPSDQRSLVHLLRQPRRHAVLQPARGADPTVEYLPAAAALQQGDAELAAVSGDAVCSLHGLHMYVLRKYTPEGDKSKPILIWKTVCYIPGLQRSIGTTSVPVEHFFLPVAFGLGLLLLDEGRKYWVRRWPKGFIARIAW